MNEPKDKKPNNKQYWRSLDQVENTPEFQEFLHREFPQGASEMNNDWTRRNFLTLMGASLALAGLASCRRPQENIVPYVKPPEEVIPGEPLFYATTMPLGNSNFGLIVETHEGRPTKIEGNPAHPSSKGGTNVWIQGSILSLYDPDRSDQVKQGGVQSSWEEFVSYWRGRYPDYKKNQGEGLAILSESYASPTFARLRKKFEETFPKADWVTYEAIDEENSYEAMRMAAGRPYRPVFDYAKAKVILALDADFNISESENVTSARGFADGRRIKSEKDEMNRLYVVEPGFTTTGAISDHRLRLKSSQIGSFVVALARELKSQGLNIDLSSVKNPGWLPAQATAWLKPLAADLLSAKGESLVVVGRRQPSPVHVLVYMINAALGNVGETVNYYELTDVDYSRLADFSDLNKKMKDGKVSTLVILGGNPVYNAPADFDFANSLKKVADVIHLSHYHDETSQSAKWHIPQAHYMEGWSDARSADGTLSVVQPMIAPLLNGVGSLEVLDLIASGENKTGYDLVRETWRPFLGSSFDRKWDKLLNDGLLAESASRPVSPRINSSEASKLLSQLSMGKDDGVEVVFHLSPSLYDGRYANNGWMQELPDSVTKISWDNVAQMSYPTAKKLGVENFEVVKLDYRGKQIELPVWIVFGTTDDTVMVELGYGRKNIGRVANDVGANGYALRTSDAMHFDGGLKITSTGRKVKLANTQDHGTLEGRPLVREASLDNYREDPKFAQEAVEHEPLVSMWNDFKYDKGLQWGMVIDLTACTGCNTCTIACQSENNIPIVGKEQVHNGREMHWIRVDRYYTTESGHSNNDEMLFDAQPGMVHQPIPCMQCEMAPCEQVCPVGATMHDEQGLNMMVYNRCIGTRYCSNNCPYKVRRFNFFNYTKDTPEIVKMAMNPNVTVRSRGVMEKCSYCLQRINRAKANAKLENREVRDGDVVTACQQACPTKAIYFGDIRNPDSVVTAVKKRNLNYSMLIEENTRPRTTYLAKIRNPNPNMPKAS
jgi:molybdopterin-containing oxidoreductase family iron-sulfur binding subunit